MEKQQIEEYIENIFSKSKINYKRLTDDKLFPNDIDYQLQSDFSDIISGMGEVSMMLFISIMEDICKYTIILPKIYNLKNTDELILLNKVNQKLNSGKVLWLEKLEQVIFVEEFYLDDVFQFSEEILDSLIMSAKIAIAAIYSEIKGNNDEK